MRQPSNFTGGGEEIQFVQNQSETMMAFTKLKLDKSSKKGGPQQAALMSKHRVIDCFGQSDIFDI